MTPREVIPVEISEEAEAEVSAALTKMVADERRFSTPDPRIARLEVALDGAYSWIDRWAKHVPNCRAPMRPCTCGRDAVMYEASKALEKDDAN